jgi:transposase
LSCVPGLVAAALLPHLSGTVTVGVRTVADRVFVLVKAAAGQAACPGCGAVSGRVHSRYTRRLRDVPAGGRPVVIVLEACRFRCLNPACGKVTFAAQVEGLTSPFARRTPPLRSALGAIAAALCGRAGARLGAGLAAPASRQAMIRLVMAAPEEELAAAPAVLGVDDFALRKGQVYGTVLVAMHTGAVVDLLPDREAATLRKWLQDHPGAAVICRDRGGAYADGARQGAPDAIQVADRWHLWHNLGEKAREAAAAHTRSCLAPRPGGRHQPPPPPPPPPDPGPAPGRAARTRRRHAQVAQLLDAGHSLTAAAAILGLTRQTARRYARAATAAALDPAAAEPALDPFKPHLTRAWNHGTRDPATLHAQITAAGYDGPAGPVAAFTAGFRDLLVIPAAAPPLPAAATIARWLMTRPGTLSPRDAAALAAVTAACPHLAVLRGHIGAFADIMTTRTGTRHLDNWLDAAANSGLDQLASFAAGIRKDHAAVAAGLSQPWSSGKVEGTVNKIKMLKRQTYGRASFPLLRKRVLLTSKPAPLPSRDVCQSPQKWSEMI